MDGRHIKSDRIASADHHAMDGATESMAHSTVNVAAAWGWGVREMGVKIKPKSRIPFDLLLGQLQERVPVFVLKT